MKGTVVKLLGKVCTVREDLPQEEQYECYLRGRLFEGSAIQLAVGDRVEFDPVEEFHHLNESGKETVRHFTGVVHEVLPRRTALCRPARRRGGEPQVIAANVDQLVVVSALESPRFKTGLIDRYLVIANRANIHSLLCLNKIDLGGPAELQEARAQHRPYEAIGLPVIFTSAVTGEGTDALKEHLRHKRSVLAGHSGVGKSKLAGRIQPGLTLASSQVSRRGKGRHTTSVSTLVPLDFGGELVDTPGVRELGIGDVERHHLARHFVEFAPFLRKCRFASCSHIPEPVCGVKEAVEAGNVHPTRYQSYVRLYRELASRHQ